MDMAGRSSWAKGPPGGSGGRDLDKELKQNSQNRYKSKRQNEINQRPDDEGINNNLVKLENR